MTSPLHILGHFDDPHTGAERSLPDLADALSWGPGPRAAQALMLMVRARALLDGRLAPSIADVADLAQSVLVHRMALSFAARARGETLAGIISRVTTRVLRLEAAA